jgi:hypothetical protein
MSRARLHALFGLAVTVVAVVALPSAVDACSCVSSSSCQRFAMSGVVFAGEVVDVKDAATNKVARLKVIRSYKGDAVAGETVTLTLPRGSSASCSLDVDPGDRYVIHGGRKAGQYSSSLCAGSYGLRSGDPLPDLPPPAGQVTGRLYRFTDVPGAYERNGVIGARVWVVTPDGPIETRTDGDGRFRLTGVPQGPRMVRFEVGPGEGAEERIDLQFAGDCAEVYAIPGPTGRVVGAVLDHTGTPVVDAKVYLSRPGEEKNLNRSTESGPSGTFDLRGLPPGPYIVGVGVHDAPSAKFPYVPVYLGDVNDPARAKTIEVGAGTTQAGAIRLGPPLALTSIAGEIVCRDGTQPAPDKAWLSAKRLSAVGVLTLPDTSGPPVAGKYTVRVLPGHRYAVVGEVWVLNRFGDGMDGYNARATNAIEVDADRPPAVLKFVAPFDKCDAPGGPVWDRR